MDCIRWVWVDRSRVASLINRVHWSMVESTGHFHRFSMPIFFVEVVAFSTNLHRTENGIYWWLMTVKGVRKVTSILKDLDTVNLEPTTIGFPWDLKKTWGWRWHTSPKWWLCPMRSQAALFLLLFSLFLWLWLWLWVLLWVLLLLFVVFVVVVLVLVLVVFVVLLLLLLFTSPVWLIISCCIPILMFFRFFC